MEIDPLQSILKRHGLRITDCRLDVLDFFIVTDHAISTRELEDNFGQYDRVTLYRTISSFVENGVLHSIPDDSGFARYGVCHETCSPKDHQHIMFISNVWIVEALSVFKISQLQK